ncbi:MAG: DNA gyrase subunit A [Candidatus Brocadiia bacterium]|nr:DNA gyrase subunit A [Candidatus Brocadiia bacterium]
MADTNTSSEIILIEDEMRESYLTFAMSVIVSRALPDVRDGLKPVQRRILMAMHELNLGPRAKHRKCGKVVGDTHGNYHPHGDLAIYDTAVRMAQPFNFRYPLLDGHGNFGSMDGDPAAAMRYTAARLSEVGAHMLEDLNLDTVDFVDNYEGTRKEPTVLPGKFPNLLVNGASGIAVGMATSVPPHNLGEVVEALIRVIENPDVSIGELLEVLPGPDFPTGGLICGRAGIVEGYTTGRGMVTMRARTRIEETDKGRQRIVVTEIPYRMNRDNLVSRIAEAVQSGAVEDVSDIRNESDKSGTRLVIELKRGAETEVVLNQLFRRTPLQHTFSIMLIVIDDGKPVTVGIKTLLTRYVEHRVDVIRRRTAFLLARAEERAHVLEGLRIALVNLDEVIKIIRSSQATDEARARLMESFDLTRPQADAILAMRLQSLVGLEQLKVEQEHGELMEKIRDYRQILADKALVLDIIREDLYEMREKYGDERRTTITAAAEDIARMDLIPVEDVVVTISHSGYVKRIPLGAFRSQGRGGKGVIGADLKEEDLVGHVFVASTHDYIMLFTTRGLVYWLRVFEIPEMSRTSKGRALVNMVAFGKGERITEFIPVKEFEKDFYLLLATARGTVKKTALDAFGKRGAGGIIAIDLPEGDRLVGVCRTDGEQEVVLATQGGMSIRFHESDVRAMGRGAAGVRGIRLARGDSVVDMAQVTEDAEFLTVCERGYGKRTSFGLYTLQRRGGQGLIDIKTTARNGKVVAALAVREDNDVMIMSQGGMMVRIPVSSVRSTGRNTQGVRLVGLGEGDRVTGIARVLPENGEEGEEDDSESEAPPQPEEQ